MLGIETFRERHLLWIPSIPLSRLVAADQHDNVALGVEGEQQPRAAVHAHLLQLAKPRPVDHIHLRTPQCRSPIDHIVNSAFDLLAALIIQRV
jgi:hypothetical protein